MAWMLKMSDTACLASTPGIRSLTAVWIPPGGDGAHLAPENWIFLKSRKVGMHQDCLATFGRWQSDLLWLWERRGRSPLGSWSSSPSLPFLFVPMSLPSTTIDWSPASARPRACSSWTMWSWREWRGWPTMTCAWRGWACCWIRRASEKRNFKI